MYQTIEEYVIGKYGDANNKVEINDGRIFVTLPKYGNIKLDITSDMIYEIASIGYDNPVIAEGMLPEEYNSSKSR